MPCLFQYGPKLMKFDPALVIWPFTTYLFRPTCDHINMVPLFQPKTQPQVNDEIKCFEGHVFVFVTVLSVLVF